MHPRDEKNPVQRVGAMTGRRIRDRENFAGDNRGTIRANRDRVPREVRSRLQFSPVPANFDREVFPRDRVCRRS